ncbi:MAG: hypothetical protein A2Y67_00700 [Candidatus Buchananbacteria bacterium RBG_13_39_9]|uniref:Uncharacterized protein n=1 Tax=Candidatus Buchananbacteria bacterium RBG_13_39_9 TaxID=1797531 RepID=A0A1G1XN84_9BACT|nr:MAG: hypothetical protein A2Y67_00700 [Candidatus Buchananbacteria bacterium RBG_13_39_9]
MKICDEYRNKVRITSDMIQAATDDELIELKELVNEDITSIAIQLDDAKTKLSTQGIYSDPEWYHKAFAAKKIKGQLNLKIQNEMSRRRKAHAGEVRRQREEEKILKKEGKDRLAYLIEAMKQVLTTGQFEEVMEVWKELRHED